MPLQIILPGTFPGSNLVNVNTPPTPPVQFGTNLGLWIKADVGVTNDGSGNAASWQDQSSNALMFSNPGSTSSANPLIIASAQNGLPGVQNNGSAIGKSNFLRAGFSASLDFLATQPFSVIAAYIPSAGNSGATYDSLIGSSNGSSSAGIGWMLGNISSSNDRPCLRLINSRQTVECSVGVSNALSPGAVIVAAVNNGTGTAAGIQIYVNGVLQATTTILDTLAGASTQAGTGLGTPGNGSGTWFLSRAVMLEAMVITKAVTARDVALNDAYLNGKWAIHA
jgi:hypothetical protein